ncbi:MAG: FtsL-like putative cell division protein [Chitinophagaceae bacterium]
MSKQKKGINILGMSISSPQWITHNISFFVFLSVLAIFYIANGHMSDKTIRNIHKLEAEIEQLKYEYKTLKSEVMFTSEAMQIKKAAEPLGLEITNDIPTRIVVK